MPPTPNPRRRVNRAKSLHAIAGVAETALTGRAIVGTLQISGESPVEDCQLTDLQLPSPRVVKSRPHFEGLLDFCRFTVDHHGAAHHFCRIFVQRLQSERILPGGILDSVIGLRTRQLARPIEYSPADR
jgi:hypothetical protein